MSEWQGLMAIYLESFEFKLWTANTVNVVLGDDDKHIERGFDYLESWSERERSGEKIETRHMKWPAHSSVANLWSKQDLNLETMAPS